MTNCQCLVQDQDSLLIFSLPFAGGGNPKPNNKYKYKGINDRSDLLFLPWCTSWVFIKLQPPTPIFQYRISHPFQPKRLDSPLLVR